VKKHDIKTSDCFDDWLENLTDKQASRRIKKRIWMAEHGNFGKGRLNIAGGVSEMKIDYGPGYRLYY